MMQTPRPLVLVALALLVLAGGARTASQAPQPAAGSNHVVLISLDGFAGWAMDDPYLPVPTLRRLAAEGVMARQGMRGVNPTVTWPTHTSMVTGVTPARHGVLFNGTLIREPGVPPRIEPWRDRNEMVRARTVYDAVHERGLTTAQVDWVAIHNAPTITWEFAERPDPASQIPREMVEAGLISQADVEAFHTRNIVWRDHVWTQAGIHIIRQHRPNLLLFHLLNLDSTQHRYGPRTPAAMSAMSLLDAQVAALLHAVRDSGLADRTTVFVVSDHGFKGVKRHIRPNVAFMKEGLLQTKGDTVAKAQAYSVPEGGTAIVYITVPDPDGAILARAKKALAGVEGLAAIVEPPDFPRYGLPDPSASDQMGSLFLVAKDGYAFTAAATGDVVADTTPTSLGSHGYLAEDPDLRSLFIASGRGIRRGVALDSADVLDLAPTMARLLGVRLDGIEGREMTAILDLPAR
jgi:predicted AlkP superfamily pyrophosphatase or phosphodiesterase